MPWAAILGACIALPALIGLGAWGVLGILYPAGLSAAWVGGVGVGLGALLGPALVQVWKPRRLPEWPMLLVGSQGLTLFGVLASSLSLYSATRPDKVAFAVVVGVSFIAVLVAHTRLFAVGLRGSVTTAGASAEPAQTRP